MTGAHLSLALSLSPVGRLPVYARCWHSDGLSVDYLDVLRADIGASLRVASIHHASRSLAKASERES